jgi:hypothetical protein
LLVYGEIGQLLRSVNGSFVPQEGSGQKPRQYFAQSVFPEVKNHDRQKQMPGVKNSTERAGWGARTGGR